MASQQIAGSMSALQQHKHTRKRKPKMLNKCCLETLIAGSRNKEMQCPECYTSYNITNDAADQMFNGNDDPQDSSGIGVLDLNPEDFNCKLEILQNKKKVVVQRLEMLEKQKEEISKQIERDVTLVEQAAEHYECNKKTLCEITPKWDASKQKWEIAKESTEKADTVLKKAKEHLEGCEKTLQGAMEQYEIALKAQHDALKEKEKADLSWQTKQGSYEFIKQHYEVVSVEYEEAKPEYEKVMSEAKMLDENLKKMEDEVKKGKEKLTNVEKERELAKYNIQEIGFAIKEVELSKEKIEVKRRKLDFMNKDKIWRATIYNNKEIEVVAPDVNASCGITVSRNGNILFTDIDYHTVTILTPQGERKCVGKEGSGESEFKEPYDVATNRRDDIFIPDYKNQRLQILDDNGKFVRQVKVDYYPSGICLDEQENVYVTTDSGEIIKYDKDWKVVKRMTSAKFESLQYLVHHQGCLYLADCDANVIHVVTAELEYVRSIGDEGLLDCPNAITIDTHNTLLVTGSRGVAAVTLDGEFITKIAAESIKHAGGITCDQSGDKIIVCDSGNRRVVRL